MQTLEKTMAETEFVQMSIVEIFDNFEYLDDWDDRYRYLIELGRTLEPLPAEHQNDTNKVQGCVSQVWLWSQPGIGDDPIIHFIGNSDAHIVSGLVAITLALYSNKKASEILKIDAIEIFAKIGLEEHLTPQRSNGLRSMLARIQNDASKALNS